MKYIAHYPQHIQDQVKALIDAEKLGKYLLNKYPSVHNYNTDKALYNYTIGLKNSYMRQSSPIAKVIYDGKINVIKNALGTHTYISRVQGGKLKAKNELRIASMFKKVPEPFLKMIVVHELAHLKEKEHNKAFYKLCEHMESSYHQLELDMRLYLTHLDCFGKLF